MQTDSKSLKISQENVSPRLRLYCFPYAGGSAASFAEWQKNVSQEIEICAVELPGRGRRFNEPTAVSLSKLTQSIADVIASKESPPFAFFGHSLGALLAFEVARYLSRHGLALPFHLFVSGASAPQCRRPMKRIHELDDDTLISELKKYNGTPQAVLDNRELMEFLLPMIRADFSLAVDYTYTIAPLLDISMTVMMGDDDENNGGDHARGWEKETTKACEFACFKGDHFYIQTQRGSVLDYIQAKLLKM